MKIEKVGMFNTYYAEVKGMITWVDDEENQHMTKEIIGIHFTSDDHETLSLSVSDDAQITVPFDKVMKVVEEARKHNVRLN